jgi:hypothetical protein
MCVRNDEVLKPGRWLDIRCCVNMIPSRMRLIFGTNQWACDVLLLTVRVVRILFVISFTRTSVERVERVYDKVSMTIISPLGISQVFFVGFPLSVADLVCSDNRIFIAVEVEVREQIKNNRDMDVLHTREHPIDFHLQI